MISKRIALFATVDYIGLLIANALVPQLARAGLESVIFDTGLTRNRKPIRPPPMDVDFLASQVIQKTLLPYIELKNCAQAPNLSYKQLAERYGFSYRTIQNINDPDLIAEVKAGAFIGGLSIRQYQVFEKPMIDAFWERGFLWNIHGGLLSDYKGFLIPYRAIANGETVYGWTLHEVNEGIDTGKIIETCAQPLDPHKPVLDTYVDMVLFGTDMIINAIRTELAGHAHPHQRENTGGNYYSYPTTDEMALFEKKGIQYIQSPSAYVNGLVSRFSVAGTEHAEGLKQALIFTLGAFYREQKANRYQFSQKIEDMYPAKEVGKKACARKCSPNQH